MSDPLVGVTGLEPGTWTPRPYRVAFPGLTGFVASAQYPKGLRVKFFRNWTAALGFGLIATALALPSVATATSGTVWSDGTVIIFDDGVRLSTGGGEIRSISCSSAGNCTAVGEFTNPSTFAQAFTVSSVDGVWGVGRPTVFDPGIRNPTGESELRSVSCASAGNCVAVGEYFDPDYRRRPFLVVSTGGTWGPAVPVTFPPSVERTPPNSKLIDVDCTSTGNCTAIGEVRTQNGSYSGFTMSSTSGTWGTPTVISFPNGVLPTVHEVFPYELDCASAGNCTVVGSYYEADGDYQAFASTSVAGAWGPAETIEFPPSTLNTSAEAELKNVSCPTIGSCTATGYFRNTSGAYLGFTVTSTGGDWSLARPESATHFPNAIHCTSTGDCTVVGEYTNVSGRTQPYTVTSTNGQWGSPAQIVFGDGVQNVSPRAVLHRVSCSSPGNCTAIGFFDNTGGDTEGFTISSVDGVWMAARPVVYETGSGSSRRPGSIKDVSCSSGGLCTVGGRFTLTSGNEEIFVMSSNEAPPPTTTMPSTTLPNSSTVAPSTTTLPSTTLPSTTLPNSSTATPSTTLPPPALDTVRALPPAPTPIVADTSIDTGEAITVSFGGFTPFELVQLVVASTPQVIGSGYANAQGVVTLTGNLPTNLTSGTHTLAVYAPGSGIGFTQSITVTALTLPTTGSSRGDRGAQVALWVLLAGIGAIVVTRRRNA